MPVLLNFPMDIPVIQGIDSPHEQKCRRHTGTGAHSASHGTAHRMPHPALGILRHGQAAHLRDNQKPCHEKAYGHIRNLLQYLRRGGLCHALMGLKIPSQDPQNPVNKHRGGKYPQHGNRLLRHEQPRPEKQKKAGDSAHGKHITDSTQKNPVGIPVLLHPQLLGDYLGNRGRYAIRRYHQHNCIIIIGRRIIAHACLAYNRH